MSMKYIVVCRLETQKIINTYKIDTINEEQIKKDSDKVCQQIKSMNLQQEQREKINTSNGSWFCKIDQYGLLYLILGMSTYPQRHAYSCISELQEEFSKLGNYAQQDDVSLKLHIKKAIKELGQKYNDLVSLDKIYFTQQQVDETKIFMENNVKQMIQSVDNLDGLEIKARNMKDEAKNLQKNSAELASIMYWRNMKLKIMIGFIILAGLLYIIVPIVIQVSVTN